MIMIRLISPVCYSKLNRPAALGAYKDINDAAAADPVLVLGRTWKKLAHPDDYGLPEQPVLEAYQDVIKAVKDPKPFALTGLIM
ncbi:hypothetical protein E2P81_ATG03924 [Venturia nashicola]|nr:hypothetical protein E2P81_ATG03924 [Venturia nashicola]